DSRKLPSRADKCTLVSSTDQRLKQLRSALDEVGLTSAPKYVGKFTECPSFLLCRLDKLLRTARLGCNPTKPRQQPRYRSADHRLDQVAIKAKRGRDTPNHFGR